MVKLLEVLLQKYFASISGRPLRKKEIISSIIIDSEISNVYELKLLIWSELSIKDRVYLLVTSPIRVVIFEEEIL